MHTTSAVAAVILALAAVLTLVLLRGPASTAADAVAPARHAS
jgi:hypothetical protein